MPALFSRRFDAIVRVALLGGIVALVAIPLLLMVWVRTPPVTGEHRAPEQPVPFSHKLHVTAFQIDCRYCHSAVETSATAGMPSTRTCVPCHEDVWLDGPAFTAVRASLESGKPIAWKRVYDLPDFVFFNHAIHVNKGVGCESCHGRVDRMDRIEQAVPLTMSWCLSCHVNPGPELRPVEAVTAMGWKSSEPPHRLAAELLARYDVTSMTECTACHR